jgi:hypothetical protein
MVAPRAFQVLVLVWMLGWGFLLLKFPTQCYRFLSWGRNPTAGQLKTAKIVGYMGLGFGLLYLVEIVFGIVHGFR